MYRWGHPMLSYLRRRCYWHWFLTERQEIRLVGAPTDYSGHRPRLRSAVLASWPKRPSSGLAFGIMIVICSFQLGPVPSPCASESLRKNFSGSQTGF